LDGLVSVRFLRTLGAREPPREAGYWVAVPLWMGRLAAWQVNGMAGLAEESGRLAGGEFEGTGGVQEGWGHGRVAGRWRETSKGVLTPELFRTRAMRGAEGCWGCHFVLRRGSCRISSTPSQACVVRASAPRTGSKCCSAAVPSGNVGGLAASTGGDALVGLQSFACLQSYMLKQGENGSSR
jgi:hypothetical protein